MQKKVIIAIDGPAGSGKSTVSRLVAKKLGLLYLDTGAMYRALTLKAMRDNLDLKDTKALINMAKDTKIDIETKPHMCAINVFLDGKDVTDKIRTPELTENIKYVARVPGVRKCMVKMQRQIGAQKGIVLEGRDTTTVVFPDAPYKFYLDASITERAKRRFKELRDLGMKTSLKEVKADAQRRDISDKRRKIGALKIAKDAIYIDTTKMSVEEVVNRILDEIMPKGKIQGINSLVSRRISRKVAKFGNK
ncbi:MAG: (d)CMP kinase [Candidatus Omnitrophica bacterium]|nr:(d)CMP kinase [Candidatus Omnitrophota bacterium]